MFVFFSVATNSEKTLYIVYFAQNAAQ